ncbi:TorF family putative porin [Shewanella gaetbuli]|uniref:TorF family putative porin n=1 Tax=Shewanella gaetbuli TaxID=220752 RepID=A0A9X2CJR0_9GAMM|nr:TorF family putative porin [Shewanella gaetbuli]MCL1142291.1 TorF family putative porin [Shewanella gaetbuli]
MKKSLLQAVALSSTLLLSGSALAEVSANIGATSNYLWRGQTQTDDSVAVQGGIDYGHESGFYVGGWASNVDFGDGTTYEADVYLGFGQELDSGFIYDISYLYYAYPDSDDSYDFGEVSLTLGYKWFDVGYSTVVNADSDVSGAEDETDWNYLQANLTIPVSDTLSVGLHYGYSSGDVVEDLNGDTYSDYNVSLSADTDIGTVSFMVSSTDLDEDDAKVVLGYSYGFDL